MNPIKKAKTTWISLLAPPHSFCGLIPPFDPGYISATLESESESSLKLKLSTYSNCVDDRLKSGV